MTQLSVLCSYLAVIVLGLSAGAMLTGVCVLVPFWQSVAPATFLEWFAANAERMLRFFGPLQSGAILVTFAATVLDYITASPGRHAFAVATLLAVAVLATFPMYFQAVNARFGAGTIPLEQVAAELSRYAFWQWVRTAVGIAACAAASVAVGLHHG